MFKKFLVVGSRGDLASKNIVANLLDLGSEGRFEFYLIDGEMLDTKCLDSDKINQYDFVIFASKHKSERKEKTISIHSPGNFREVWGGGEPGKLSLSSALFQKHLFSVLKKTIEDSILTRYLLTMEVTHHGPLIERPSVFVEIGGSEEEWRDKKASFVVAKAIRNAIETWEENPYHEVAVGIGGPHYCPNFNKLQLNSNVAFSHVIPKYVSPITEEMILETINKTVEEVDFVVLDWKGLGKSEERDEIIKILEKNYIQWKKSSDFKT
ncbi:MAG: hypothetical protein NUV46_02460 [Nanoarchaeota archaeon]|nr:hypothetical protein [Nanoarchaeota archaeon]